MHVSTLRCGLLAAALAGLAGAQAHAATEAPSTRSVASPHAASSPAAPAAPKTRVATAPVKLVDINRAGRKELMTLPGVGAAEADKIIANRPYMTKTDLVGKQVLPMGPYLSLKNQVIALPKGRPQAKP